MLPGSRYVLVAKEECRETARHGSEAPDSGVSPTFGR